MVTKVFKWLINRNMDAYVDDMLVKSLSFEHYLKDLKEIFTVLRSYKMKLNPAKYVFSIKVGKFLGFIVSRNRIEPNLEQLKALADMSLPRTFKKVQVLIRQIVALSRFILKMVDRCLPFFKSLLNITKFLLMEEC